MTVAVALIRTAESGSLTSMSTASSFVVQGLMASTRYPIVKKRRDVVEIIMPFKPRNTSYLALFLSLYFLAAFAFPVSHCHDADESPRLDVVDERGCQTKAVHPLLFDIPACRDSHHDDLDEGAHHHHLHFMTDNSETISPQALNTVTGASLQPVAEIRGGASEEPQKLSRGLPHETGPIEHHQGFHAAHTGLSPPSA